MPSFLKILFSVFTAILLFFIVLILITILEMESKFNSFKQISSEITFSSDIWIPISDIYLAGN